MTTGNTGIKEQMGQHTLHKSDSRGLADHGWLLSRHTFSFANYFDPQRIQFGALRVLNDDIVQPGMGFGTHPHNNMEIISIPLSGALEHKDSTGRTQAILTGDVQIMSAGSGLHHSEYNHSSSEEVNFLQIWVLPKEKNISPRYEQKTFDLSASKNTLVNVVAPDNGKAVWINQDAWFYLGEFDADETYQYKLQRSGSGVYVFLIEGAATINGVKMQRRDGLGINELENIKISTDSDSKILLMEIPMNI